MNSQRRWFWVLLFVVASALLGTLATTYNVAILTKLEAPAWPVVLGIPGFIIVLAGLAIFFIRLLREMKLNQTQSMFLASVSHALKTPIATLQLSSSLLRDPEVSDEEKQSLWISHDSELKRLREQVDILLEAARWESASVSLARAPMPLEDWVNQSLDRWRGLLGTGARLERRGEPLHGAPLLDSRLIALITDNLVDNARKFAQGSPEVIIHTHWIPRKGLWKRARWSVEFSDRGWGFQPNENKNLFRRFFRSTHPAPYAIPGTGLGLWLAASAARMQGLKLTAQSGGPGKGARFTLEGSAE